MTTIAQLEMALARAPSDHRLRIQLAQALRAEGDFQSAITQLKALFAAEALQGEALLDAGEVALRESDLDFAARCLDRAQRTGVVDGVTGLKQVLEERFASTGVVRLSNRSRRAGHGGPRHRLLDIQPDEPQGFLFSDVIGLDDAKRYLHRRLVLPLRRPSLYERYQRRTGGAVLLYGPTGCGKSMLAEAVAHEAHVPLIDLRLERLLESQRDGAPPDRDLRRAFQVARRHGAAVLRIERLDRFIGLGSHHVGIAPLIEGALCDALDRLHRSDDRLLIIATAENHHPLPAALLRGGRLSQQLHIELPGRESREEILRRDLDACGAESIDTCAIAAQTELFSAADLHALVNKAIDHAIERALLSCDDAPLLQTDLEYALLDALPTNLARPQLSEKP